LMRIKSSNTSDGRDARMRVKRSLTYFKVPRACPWVSTYKILWEDFMTTQEVKRKLTAILSADVKGYSRLMGEDEEWTLRTLNAYKEVMRSLIQQHRGRVVSTEGDRVLAEFASVVDAVQCAVEIQQVLRAKNAVLPENRRMDFRIGINLGDVIEEGDSIYGDGVNIAARLEGLAEAGGICISESAYQQIENKLPLRYDYMGEHEVKNIAKPVRVYRARIEPEAVPPKLGEEKEPARKGLSKAILAIIAVVVIAGLVALYQFVLRPSPSKTEVASKERMALPLPDKPSIAVLPFVNMSGDPQQEYFSDGLTEEIITALSKTPKLFVIARNSSSVYKGKAVNVQQVSRELGVKYVMEGSVRRSGNQLRITAQLIDATTGNHLWAERYDRELKDIFATQDEITMKILTSLQVSLTEGEAARMQAKGTNNLDAYLLFLQGWRETGSMNKDSNFLGRQMAEKAIALDPKYAMAYNLLATTYMNEVLLGLSEDPRLSLKRAMELTQKAIALDNSLAWPHALLGWIYTLMLQHDKGIAECEQAVNLEPNSAISYFYLSLALKYAGRPKEAITMAKEAIRLNPIPPGFYYQNITHLYCLTGQYEEAIKVGKEATRVEPNNFTVRAFLTVAYSLHGRQEEARIEAAEVLRINPKFRVEHWAKTIPFKNEADRELTIGALRKAGLK
jgi:adenylate cyclase